MGNLVPVLIAVGAFALVWRLRSRRGAPLRRSPLAGLRVPVQGSVWLVAEREVRTRLRGRTFRVVTLLILAAVGAAIVIPTVDKGSNVRRVGVVGTLAPPLRAATVAAGKSSGAEVRLVAEPGIAAARADLRSGRISLAVVDGGSLLVRKAIAADDVSTTAQLVRAVANTLGFDAALAAAQVSAAQAARIAGARPLPVRGLEGTAGKPAARGAVQTVLILLFVMLSQYGTWTMLGVMEEKAGRVVEVLLSAVRPVQLLAGKVLGIGIVVFAQASVVVGFALVLAKAVGSDLVHGSTPRTLVAAFVWLVLGYAFYSWVYAAAGSMGDRRDQVQTLAVPLAIPTVLAYVLSLRTAATGSPSLFFDVLAYLPPTSPFAMPVLVSLGKATWWEFAASVAISIACTVGVARLASAVYRRAILRTGRRVALREIFARSSG
jgi:ABC-2 type transport system permease protein